MAKNWYDEGQHDGAKNTHNPPPRVRPIIDIFDSCKTTQEKIDNNKAYQQGWEHARKNR